ncbi:unnamed protein product [Effrenium voratum]|nr:unnamed protein product [Effrenium voratum]
MPEPLLAEHPPPSRRFRLRRRDADICLAVFAREAREAREAEAVPRLDFEGDEGSAPRPPVEITSGWDVFNPDDQLEHTIPTGRNEAAADGTPASDK